MSGLKDASALIRTLAHLALVAFGFLLAVLILELSTRTAPGLFRPGAIRNDFQLQELLEEEAARLTRTYGQVRTYRSLVKERIFKIGVPYITFNVYGLDYTSSVTYNSLGIRDREPLEVSHMSRILLLGDSFVEGKAVKAVETISAQLETELRERGNPCAVINAGVGGTGTTNQLHLLRYLGVLYSPQTVVLAVYPGNDLRSNSLLLDSCLAIARSVFAGGTFPRHPTAVRGYYWKGRDGQEYRYVEPGRRLETVLEEVDLKSLHYSAGVVEECCLEENRRPTRRVLTALGGFSEASRVLESLLLTAVEIKCEPRVEGIPVSLLGEVDDPAAAKEEAWEITRHLLRLVQTETAGLGARLMVVALPGPVQVDSRKRSATFRAYGLDPARASKSGPEVRLSEILSDLGIPFLDLITPTRAEKDVESLFLPIDNHPNPSGNRFFARRIAEAVTRL